MHPCNCDKVRTAAAEAYLHGGVAVKAGTLGSVCSSCGGSRWHGCLFCCRRGAAVTARVDITQTSVQHLYHDTDYSLQPGGSCDMVHEEAAKMTCDCIAHVCVSGTTKLGRCAGLSAANIHRMVQLLTLAAAA